MPSARPLSGFLITPARDLLASLLKIPATRVLLIATIAWLTIFGLLKERLWRDPHSGFFESATVYDLHYSAFRRDEAQAWAAEQERGAMPTHEHVSAPHEPAICAGLVTYNRPQRQYLNETIGSLLEGLTADERRALDVRLLFAHSEPGVHPDWNRTWLRAIDSWSGYDDLTKSELERVLIAEKERNFYVKGIVDYTYILNECLTHTTAPYIALFEDDIIFAEGWLVKTAAAILELSKGSKASTNWLYLRLFYTETSLGWDEEIDFWYRNMRLTFALAIVSMLTFLLSIRAWSARLRPRLDLATIAVLALIVAPAFTQLVFMVGKYNLFPLQGVVRIDRFGCCTQGLVFPRAKAIDLLHALEGRDGQTDSMIEAYADEQGLERYALAPQVLQHVGLVSSRDNLAINTQSTWAFWFEAQRPEVLKREHWKLAAEVDWKVLRRSASA